MNRKRPVRKPNLSVEEAGNLVHSLLEALGDSACCRPLLAKELGVPYAGDDKAALAVVRAFRKLVLDYTHLARNGNEAAIEELPYLTRLLVQTLGDLAREQPEKLTEAAQQQLDWPIMAARHFPKESDFKELADAIGLGTKTVVNLSPRARYKLTTPINRFLLQLLSGSIATAREFYFVELPDNPPKLTAKTLSYYLDEIIMPLLDEVREKENSWNGIPAIADIVKNIVYESEHRSAVRNRIKRALKAMAGAIR